MFPALKAVRDSLENSYFAHQKEVEDKAVALYNTDKQAALDYLNLYSNQKGAEMIQRWRQLATYLIVKYNPDLASTPSAPSSRRQATSLPLRPSSRPRKPTATSGCTRRKTQVAKA